jgi:dTDP-4-dehydrorhamnose 3,5-epimerase-like enzyme
MRCTETRLKGAFVIDMGRIEGEQCFFARTFCARELGEHGLNATLVQCHRFSTLAADTEVAHQVRAIHSPEHERGLRYDDPAAGIQCGVPVQVISQKDRNCPLLRKGTAAGTT